MRRRTDQVSLDHLCLFTQCNQCNYFLSINIYLSIYRLSNLFMWVCSHNRIDWQHIHICINYSFKAALWFSITSQVRAAIRVISLSGRFTLASWQQKKRWVAWCSSCHPWPSWVCGFNFSVLFRGARRSIHLGNHMLLKNFQWHLQRKKWKCNILGPAKSPVSEQFIHTFFMKGTRFEPQLTTGFPVFGQQSKYIFPRLGINM